MPNAGWIGFDGLLRAVSPVANRLVFYGIETCRDFLDPTVNPVRGRTIGTRQFHALTADSAERLSAELSNQDIRVRRQRETVEWRTSNGLSLIVESAVDGPADHDALLLEYGTLVTRTVKTQAGLAYRAPGLALQFALLWRLHRNSGQPLTESTVVEDLVELVAQYEGLVGEIHSLPDDIRPRVVLSVEEFRTHPATVAVVSRALQDARFNPRLAADLLRPLAVVGTSSKS